MSFNEVFSSRLRALRQSRGLTQKQLGEKVGLSLQAINEIEHGRNATFFEKASMLADALDTSLDYLAGRVGAPEQADSREK